MLAVLANKNVRKAASDINPFKKTAVSTKTGKIKEGDFLDRAGLAKYQKQQGQLASEALERDAVRLEEAKQEQFRQKQMALADALEAQARGEGPSLATEQLNQARDQNIQSAMAMGVSQRGVNPALAARQVASQSAAAMQAAARDAAAARIQEQLSAREQLAGVAQSGRGQDITLAGAQADQQARQRALNDQMSQFYGQQSYNAMTQATQNAQNLAALRSGQQMSINQAQNAAAEAQKNRIMQGISAGASAGAAFAASDEKLKKDIKSADDKLGSFLDALEAKQYEYKDKKFGDGKYVSPMAQDLEKTDLGKDLVINTPEGKMVDYGKAAGTMLAAQVSLNDRLSAVERAINKRKGKK